MLLGFENYACLSLDSKMAESPSEVWEMIINLKNKSKAAAQTELLTLQVINVKGSVVYRNVFPIKIYGQKFGSNYC